MRYPFNKYGIGQIPHKIKNLYRRFRYGAGCCDVFTLYEYLAPNILSGLKEFRKVANSYPSRLNSLQEWHEIIDKMIWSFEEIQKDDFENTFDEEREKRIQEGFELFGKYFRNLWW